MTAPTNPRKGVSFVGVPPDVDKAARLPRCEDAEYAKICTQIHQLFAECQVSLREPMGFRTAWRLDSQIKAILHQLDTLPNQDDLSLRVLKVVTSRLGTQVFLRYSCRLALEYSDIAKENQAHLPQSTTASNDASPWWENLEKHWKCFFKLKTF